MVNVSNRHIQSPIKNLITAWLALSNKLLTWEMLQKRGFEGPSLCSLCRSNVETTSHLFKLCPYAGSMWKGAVDKLNADRAHKITVTTFEERTKYWWHHQRVQEHKRDVAITKTRIIKDPEINREIPWAFFDGSSQGEPPLGGARAVIHFTTKRKILLKYAMGQETNSRVELSALWATLKVAHSNRIQDIPIFRDSKVVIDWENGRNTICVPYLQHFLTEIQNLKALF